MYGTYGSSGHIYQMKEQLPSRAVVQHEEQLISRLEGHIEAHDERVFHVAEDVTLCLCVLHLANKYGRHGHIIITIRTDFTGHSNFPI